VYSFTGTADGAGPTAGVLALNGVLYGTTSSGGNGFFGAVFSLVPGAAAATVLHTFGYATDGRDSFATLIAKDGTLYGTTSRGGTHSDGTIFSITTTGTRYRVLHSFGATATDGISPFAGLTNLGNILYGTAAGGGTHHASGTVFSIVRTGTNYTTLHDFGSGSDGAEPDATLTVVDGTLYGTTIYGGKYPCALYVECGTVFEIATTGAERVLHSFGNGTDGHGPQAALLDIAGTLYGTTIWGGAYGSCANGHGVKQRCGTVFSIGASGRPYAVLHGFGKSSDGTESDGSLVDVNGTLYGTTYVGGQYGFGTLFSMSPDGSNYNAFYSFGSTSTDGRYPVGALTASNGVIYGTTAGGGTTGNGSIFALTPYAPMK
jgi:uncharacterized repeat protein (TIGR03803 family)